MALIVLALLPAAMPTGADAFALHGDRPASLDTSPVDAPEQYAGGVQDFTGFTPSPGRSLHPTLAPTGQGNTLHRSLLQAPQSLPIRPHAPAPLAPISPDPGADIIPLPGSFVGGLGVLALLVVIRYWRR